MFLKKTWEKTKKVLKKFINSRFFLATVMLAIGISWTVVWYESVNVREIFSGKTITIANASAISADETVKVEEEMSLEDLIVKTFPEEPKTALALSKAESGLDPTTESWTDRMKDGRPFSAGLMQVNLTWHTVAGTDCSKAFSGKDYYAVVVDEVLYEKCLGLAKNPNNSLEVARGIYERSGGNFGKWGAFTDGSYKRFLN